MRIDDLDPIRSRPEHERVQLADLRAIGIDWDGEPVRVSSRIARYGEAIAQLEDAGRVYPCWCTRAEIRTSTEAAHGALPEGAYPGTCRRLSAADRVDRERSGRPPALRLDAGGEVVRFRDRLHGEIEGRVDDLVLRRGDGTPAYHLAVVVDDAEQGVEEVVRGDDLLDSTPRQLLLARLLALRAPSYAHVPLVLGADGARLAKRHGAVTLADWQPAAAVEWIADSLGLGGASTASDLLDGFETGALPLEPTLLPAA